MDLAASDEIIESFPEALSRRAPRRHLPGLRPAAHSYVSDPHRCIKATPVRASGNDSNWCEMRLPADHRRVLLILLEFRLVMQDSVQQRTVDLDMSVIVIRPSLRNLFMKKLTRDLVVPIISASVSWLIFGVISCGVPSLPKCESSRSIRASRRSLELKSWSIRSSSIRLFRVRRYDTNISENAG